MIDLSPCPPTRGRRAFVLYHHDSGVPFGVAWTDRRGRARCIAMHQARLVGRYRSDFCAFGCVRAPELDDQPERAIVALDPASKVYARVMAQVEGRRAGGWIGAIRPVESAAIDQRAPARYL